MALSTTSNNAALSVAVLQEAIQAELAGRKLLLGTGAWQFMPGLPAAIGSVSVGAGTTIQVPYFAHIGEMDDVAEGDALVPRAVTSSSETATVTRSGLAAEASVLSIIASAAGDPYAEAARQIADAGQRRLDKAAIDAALAVGSTDATMVNDLGLDAGADYPILLFKRNAGITWYRDPTLKQDSDILADTEVAAANVYHATHLWKRAAGGTKPRVAKLICALTGANAFSENAVIDTEAKFIDEVSVNDPIVMLAMHSAVGTFAKKLKDSTGRRLYLDGPMEMGPQGLVKTGPDTFCGIPVFLSNRLTAS